MPQARLIDVNTAAIKHRNEVTAGLDAKNYDKVFGALYSLNALLPENFEDDGRQKYRITISDELYRKFTENKIFATCNFCKEEINFGGVKVLNLLNTAIQLFLVNAKVSKAWVCLKCGKMNKLNKTEMTETHLREPFFIRVIPRPPTRQIGLHDRSSYHKKMTQWAWTFLQEWENGIAQFRDDNWQKGGELEFAEDIDGGEELEK